MSCAGPLWTDINIRAVFRDGIQPRGPRTGTASQLRKLSYGRASRASAGALGQLNLPRPALPQYESANLRDLSIRPACLRGNSLRWLQALPFRINVSFVIE